MTARQRAALLSDVYTSHAISIAHLAAAVRNNGRGRVVTINLSAEKAVRARANLTGGGFSDVVTFEESDVLEGDDAAASIDGLLLGVGRDLGK